MNSSIFWFDFWPSKHLPLSLVEMPTLANEISYFNTAATYNLDYKQHHTEMDGRVIELVNIPSARNFDSSWRSMTTEICRKMAGFSHLFASFIPHTSTKHISRPAQSLGDTKRRLLMPFPCISCISSSSNKYYW